MRTLLLYSDLLAEHEQTLGLTALFKTNGDGEGQVERKKEKQIFIFVGKEEAVPCSLSQKQ